MTCRKDLLSLDLQTVQNPNNFIVSIMPKRSPETWLTPCSKPNQFHCQHHPEKVSWTLTYKLFETQSISLSASSRKCLLPDLHSVQNPNNSIVSTIQKRFPGSWLTLCSNPNNSIVRIMQNRPSGPWLTYCLKTKQFYCQHHGLKASWTLTYQLFKTQIHCQHHAKMASSAWLTIYSISKQFHHQHHAEKTSWTLTYILFKTQTIPLLASCRNGLLDPDLHPIHIPMQPIVSIMGNRLPQLWLTHCWISRPFCCQYHSEKASSTLTYILLKIKIILLSASFSKGLLTYTLF